VRLAAQCTDERVNKVTPALFQRFPTLEIHRGGRRAEVEEYIRSCGFYHSKAKDIVACARVLVEKYGGRVPGTMEELTALPGVGRKTANLILGDVYGQPSYVCDTHCIRITGRLGITDGSKDPLQVERQLRAVLPPKESGNFCHRMVLFGRASPAPAFPARKTCLCFWRRHVFLVSFIYCFEACLRRGRGEGGIPWTKRFKASLRRSKVIPGPPRPSFARRTAADCWPC
jgi:endonuclease-3